MAESTTWQAQFDALGEDLKAEAVYISFVQSGKKNNEILFFANGGFRRIFRKDVEEIQTPGQRKFDLNVPVIETNKRGLYDLFPEFFFHQSKSNKHFKSVGELKGEHEHHQKVETNARKFFWPLDDQLLKIKTKVLEYELTLGQSGQSSTRDYLRKFWNIPLTFDQSQSRALSKILPMAREISVNLEWVEAAFSDVLKVPVKVEKKTIVVDQYCSNDSFVLGNAELGGDTIPGNTYAEVVYGMHFTLGPIDMATANAFGPGEKYFAQFSYLINHLTPVDMETSLQLIPDSDFSFTLVGEDKLCSILGVSSILNVEA